MQKIICLQPNVRTAMSDQNCARVSFYWIAVQFRDSAKSFIFLIQSHGFDENFNFQLHRNLNVSF